MQNSQKSSLKRKLKISKKEAEKYLLKVAVDIVSRSGGVINKKSLGGGISIQVKNNEKS